MCSDLSQVCLVPHSTGVGGMVSFQRKLAEGLDKRGVAVSYSLEDSACRAVMVVGGTRHLAGLWRAKKRGVRIVQRLDGMNWLHRRLPTGLRHYLRAEYGNLLLAVIRSRFADEIVYQSRFSKNWWEKVRGVAPVPSRVIYNAVDLQEYSPAANISRPADRWRVLLVEGSLMGGYEMGLEAAVQLVEDMAKKIGSPSQGGQNERQVELVVVGRVSESIQSQIDHRSAVHIRWEGLVEPERIPDIDRSAHLLYSADINAACPNAVIEALACGLPVLSFDTGALSEMVAGGAGKVVPYGGDPWRLDVPDYNALVEAALDIIHNQEVYRKGARQRAEQEFGLDQMVQAYLHVLAGQT